MACKASGAMEGRQAAVGVSVGPDRGLHVVLTEDIGHLVADQGTKAEPSSYKKGLPSKEKLGKI